jgi:hypothetical protein
VTCLCIIISCIALVKSPLDDCNAVTNVVVLFLQLASASLTKSSLFALFFLGGCRFFLNSITISCINSSIIGGKVVLVVAVVLSVSLPSLIVVVVASASLPSPPVRSMTRSKSSSMLTSSVTPQLACSCSLILFTLFLLSPVQGCL